MIPLGAVGFACGYFSPIALNPDANQGPLLGIFITGLGGAACEQYPSSGRQIHLPSSDGSNAWPPEWLANDLGLQVLGAVPEEYQRFAGQCMETPNSGVGAEIALALGLVAIATCAALRRRVVVCSDGGGHASLGPLEPGGKR